MAVPIRFDVSSKDVVQCFKWLREQHVHLHVCKIELTMKKLRQARGSLDATIADAVVNMEGAQRNGWSVKRMAISCIYYGLVAIGETHSVIEKYDKQMDNPTSAFHCLCETLSRRTLNSSAVCSLNAILAQTGEANNYVSGFEAVATKSASDIQGRAHGSNAPRPQVSREFADMLQGLNSMSWMDRAKLGALLEGLLDWIPLAGTMLEALRADLPHTEVRNPIVACASSSDGAEGGGGDHIPNKPLVEMIQLNGYTKYRAFARTESFERVPVLIRAKAPMPIRSRAAVDLVMVLDTSASMRGYGKLDQLKQGCKFVILNLEATDRLSIVRFGKDKELLPLTSMDTKGKSLANDAVRSLVAVGNGTAGPALNYAYKILDTREPQYQNPVSSIILLTDGQDKNIFKESLNSGNKIPKKRAQYPTYTVGFGLDHDPRTLYYLATVGCGTYSFVVKNENIKYAMALLVGGLTSIVAKKMKIFINSEGYKSIIDVKDLCAGEEKNFIVYVDVPAEETAGCFLRTAATRLLEIKARYYCPFTGAEMPTDPVEISVKRPGKVGGQDCSISIEVAIEVARAKIFDGVKIWHQSIQCKQYHENFHIPGNDLKKQLLKLRDDIGESRETEESNAVKERWDDLAMDLDNMLNDVSEIDGLSNETGEDLFSRVTGLPYMLSWLSSHQTQRGVTPGSTSESRWFNFRTVRMKDMIDSVDIAPIT